MHLVYRDSTAHDGSTDPEKGGASPFHLGHLHADPETAISKVPSQRVDLPDPDHLPSLRWTGHHIVTEIVHPPDPKL